MVTLRHTSPPCRLNKDTLADCCRLEDVIIVDAVAALFVTTAQISQLCKFNMICFVITRAIKAFKKGVLYHGEDCNRGPKNDPPILEPAFLLVNR